MAVIALNISPMAPIASQFIYAYLAFLGLWKHGRTATGVEVALARLSSVGGE
jgi:hypothetical protein